MINRLKLKRIRQKTGMPPVELRRFSSPFDKIADDIRQRKPDQVTPNRGILAHAGDEDDLRQSKPNHVLPRRLMDHGSEPEAGE